jgi:hypothetical protein
LVTLADGEYGREYFRNRARIGKIHDLLEMPIKHYIGQYGVYYGLIFDLLCDRLEGNVLDAIAEGGSVATDGGAAARTGETITIDRSGLQSAVEREVESVAAANQQQQAKIQAVNEAVSRLTDAQ